MPRPYLRLNQPLVRDAVRSFHQPSFRVALAIGAHPSKLSWLINSVAVPATAANRKRLEQIADYIRLPRDQMFLSGDPQTSGLNQGVDTQ